MHWLKICMLILLVLAIMRVCSWALLWLLSKVMPQRRTAPAILANVIALFGFTSYLYIDLLPGEPIDGSAVVFDIVVFAVFAVVDIYWRPWQRPLRARSTTA